MQFSIQFATPADDAAIRQLLRREPMPGRIRVTYQREPEFRLGCEVTGEDCQVLVARRQDSDEIVGVASRSVRRVFVNGREQRVGYLGQLRIDPRFRGRWLVSRAPLSPDSSNFRILPAQRRGRRVPSWHAMRRSDPDRRKSSI